MKQLSAHILFLVFNDWGRWTTPKHLSSCVYGIIHKSVKCAVDFTFYNYNSDRDE